MKKALFLGLLAASFFVQPVFAKIETVTIVNHFGDSLRFYIDRHAKIVPDFSRSFLLQEGETVTTRVVEDKKDGEMTSAYIKVTTINEHAQENAFFGIEPQQVHGYIDRGIAFSWKNETHTVLVFCTPSDYAKKGHC